MIAPHLRKLTEVYTDVIFTKTGVNEISDVVAEVGIRAMPTFMCYKNGDKIDEVVSADLPSIEATIKKHL